MHLLQLIILVFVCLSLGDCQFSFLNLPKLNRNPAKPPKVNSESSITWIKVGPKANVKTESSESLSTHSSTSSPIDALASDSSNRPIIANEQSEPLNLALENRPTNLPLNLVAENDKSSDASASSNAEANRNLPVSESNGSDDSRNPNGELRRGKFGFGFTLPSATNFGDKFKQGLPTVSGFGDKLKQNLKPNSFGNVFKPTIPSIRNGFKPTLPSVDIPGASEFGKLANNTANTFKDLPIVSDILKIPSHFKISNLKGAVDYLTKYGHLEEPVFYNKKIFNL